MKRVAENLTKEELEELKEAFQVNWPDAAKAVKTGPKHVQYLEAACLWLGFKTGYQYGRDS